MREIIKDSEVHRIMKNELERQKSGLEMIPSENFVSLGVLEAMGSVFTNKYSEGYPRKRYYGGNENIDEMESLAIERAKKHNINYVLLDNKKLKSRFLRLNL